MSQRGVAAIGLPSGEQRSFAAARTFADPGSVRSSTMFLMNRPSAFLSLTFVRGLKRSTRKVKIVLLKDFENLGKKGDVVAVTPGYCRNYLYPEGIAVYATEPNIVQFSLPYVRHMLQPSPKPL